MALNNVKMDVDVDIKVSDSTAEKCLRILELWQNDNPDKEIIGVKKPGQEKTVFLIRIKTKGEEDESANCVP